MKPLLLLFVCIALACGASKLETEELARGTELRIQHDRDQLLIDKLTARNAALVKRGGGEATAAQPDGVATIVAPIKKAVDEAKKSSDASGQRVAELELEELRITTNPFRSVSFWLGLFSAFATGFTAWIGYKNNSLGKEHTAAIQTTRMAVRSLEKTTNGKMDQLLRTTAEAEFAKGAKSEHDKAAARTHPDSVE